MIRIWVAPHERLEAIKAYRDRLGLEDIAAIMNAPDGEPIELCVNITGNMWLQTKRNK